MSDFDLWHLVMSLMSHAPLVENVLRGDDWRLTDRSLFIYISREWVNYVGLNN